MADAVPPNHTTTSGCQSSPDDAIATRTMTGAAARIPSLQSILHHSGVEDPSTCGSKVGQSGTSFSWWWRLVMEICWALSLGGHCVHVVMVAALLS
ncbi:hypothetical protein POX_c03672 [Penicillium oxalicum]|uniref:hypothetical protein n=1 Tax=Penicillium oxalicum TaxID=69781 RepID=UPI0020B84C15|nr:hypothetical protein POX_c03672 [Penicillium oxalicum]KAI2790821.1 hypothetical protein POX_c03672 [Penicillium oxalicum]